jgi:hypothetical protein
MGPASRPLPPGLQALRNELATAEHPVTATRWLTKPSIAPVLSDLAAGRMPLTHQAFDELPGTQALAHLRQTLVTVGALPERDEEMARLETFLARLLDSQHDPERRLLLHRYLTWHLIRRLRSRNNGRPATRQQSLMIRRLSRGTVAFLDWLDARNLTLSSCQQADLDRWHADERAVYREETGRFIRWARASKLTAGYLAAAPRWNGPAQMLDHQDRWHIARRLLHDDQLKPEDRLAGLFVLLYAQGTTAISRMTVSQIQVHKTGVPAPARPRPHPAARAGRHAHPHCRGEPQRPRHHRSRAAIALALPRRPAQTAGQHRAPDPAARRPRHPSRPGPQHRALPARHRDPRRHPRPHPRNPHRRRRHMATPRRGRLDHLRRRRQPPDAPSIQAFQQFEYLTSPLVLFVGYSHTTW